MTGIDKKSPSKEIKGKPTKKPVSPQEPSAEQIEEVAAPYAEAEGIETDDASDADEAGEAGEANDEAVFSTLDLLQEIQQLREQFFRAKAETDNILKRSEREMENTRKYFVRSFLAELLEVRDSLEKAAGLDEKHATVEHYQNGLELTLRSLEKIFASHDVSEVNPVGGVFDPELHQAMGMRESADHPSGTVLDVVQKGYLQKSRLLRPALVIVSTGQKAKPAAKSKPQEAKPAAKSKPQEEAKASEPSPDVGA